MIRALAQMVLTGAARSADVKALANAVLVAEARLADILEQAQQRIGTPELDAHGQPTASHDARIGFARGVLACCEAFAGGPPRPVSDAELQSVLDALEPGPPRQEATGRGFDGPEEPVAIDDSLWPPTEAERERVDRSMAQLVSGDTTYTRQEVEAHIDRRRAESAVLGHPEVELRSNVIRPVKMKPDLERIMGATPRPLGQPVFKASFVFGGPAAAGARPTSPGVEASRYDGWGEEDGDQ